MPTGKNWLYFIYVNTGFILYTVATYYLSSIKEIKDNVKQKLEENYELLLYSNVEDKKQLLNELEETAKQIETKTDDKIEDLELELDLVLPLFLLAFEFFL